MKTDKLVNFALNRLDQVGFQLERFGVTDRVNRHNLAASVMAGRHYLEGEWDSVQARYGRQLSDLEALKENVERRAGAIFTPLRKS